MICDELLVRRQKAICDKYRLEAFPTDFSLMVGVARSVHHGSTPLHGLRHPPDSHTSGWFIWTGDYSEDPNFFEPIHATHLISCCPEVLDYLALPPGSRFLLAGEYVDVWFDKELLKI